jgi:uncharacterized membrane protein HdeD (DUF308 family)
LQTKERHRDVVLDHVVRGLLALTLGTALLFYPDRARPMLANFMGMFWLTSGIIGIRWGASGERARGLPVLAGIVGVVAGLGMLGRHLAPNVAPIEVFLSVLGLIILLTGVLHIYYGQGKGHSEGKRSWPATILGVFEIVLGLILVFAPMERGPVILVAAGIWAVLGGIILIGDALRIRRLRKRSDEE